MTRVTSVQHPVPRRLVILVWVGVALLLMIGITTSALRATHVANLYPIVEPLRTAILDAIGIADHNAVHRADLVARIDAKFATHAGATLVHVLG